MGNHNVVEYYTGLPLSPPWRVTSRYGNRKCPNCGGTGLVKGKRCAKCAGKGTAFHPGIDFGDRPHGDPIRAPFPGVVTASAAQTSGGVYVGAGNYVAVKIDGMAIIMLFFHLNARSVKVGNRVKIGDIVGYNGSTGYSTGAHLHFELRNGSSGTGGKVWGNPEQFRFKSPGKSNKFSIGTRVMVASTASLNLRAAPGTNTKVLQQLKQGTKARIISHDGNGMNVDNYHWWYVELDAGGKGWLAEGYLDKIEEMPPGECPDLVAENIALKKHIIELETKIAAAQKALA